MLNLSASIAFHQRTTPDKAAIIYHDQPISYAVFHRRILRMAGYLGQCGIGAGDVVALFMKNSPAFLEVAYAVSMVGGVFLPINYRLSASEAQYILQDAGTRLLFVDEEFGDICELEIEKRILDSGAQADTGMMSALNRAPDGCTHVMRADDIARLMYTSGTTSHPKGVVHTCANIHWKSVDHIITLGLGAHDILLTVGPLYHVGAFDLPGIAIFEVGGTMCLLREFDPVAVLQAIERHRVTCSWMAPVMLGRVLAVPDAADFDLASFRWCIAGGEKTPESRIRDFTRVFTHARFVDAFGMTETCSGDTLMDAGMALHKIGSVGRAVPHVEIRIVDELGQTLPPNAIGEICIRGPKVSRCYWNAPEKTRESFFGEWLRSGDVGYLDEDGFLYLTDRSKDMILSGAENVASLEVENVIYKLPEVVDVAVVGVPDPQWGERIVAVVVLVPGAALDLPALQAHCRNDLARFKIPRQLQIVDSLPRNPSGKVLKRVLRDQFAGA